MNGTDNSQKKYKWPIHIEEMLNIFGRKGNAIKTTLRFHFTQVKMTVINNTKNNKYWRGCGDKRNTSVDGNVN
jgi:hypothetical protein